MDLIKKYIPYTYLIGWTKYNKWYYGVEFKNNKMGVANPENLWNIYFTSSKNLVSLMRENFGDPDIIEIRKTFKRAKDAINWELKVLRRMKVLTKLDIWLNRTNNKAIIYDKHPRGMLGRKQSEETKRKHSETCRRIGLEPLIKYDPSGKPSKLRGRRQTPEIISKRIQGMKLAGVKPPKMIGTIASKKVISGSIWINDGFVDRRITGGIPPGWIKGRLYKPRNRKRNGIE